MTKCVMRELENLGDVAPHAKAVLIAARQVVKLPCQHTGGILPPNECIKNYIGKRNEQKVFIATQDEDLRNDLRNNGSAPIFFFRNNVLIMDSPSDVTEQKFKLKEQLKLEPTKAEKKFLAG